MFDFKTQPSAEKFDFLIVPKLQAVATLDNVLHEALRYARENPFRSVCCKTSPNSNIIVPVSAAMSHDDALIMYRLVLYCEQFNSAHQFEVPPAELLMDESFCRDLDVLMENHPEPVFALHQSANQTNPAIYTPVLKALHDAALLDLKRFFYKFEPPKTPYKFDQQPSEDHFYPITHTGLWSADNFLPQVIQTFRKTIAEAGLMKAKQYPHVPFACQLTEFEPEYLVPIHPRMQTIKDVFAMETLVKTSKILHRKMCRLADGKPIDFNQSGFKKAMKRIAETDGWLVDDFWCAVKANDIRVILDTMGALHAASLRQMKNFYKSFDRAAPEIMIVTHLSELPKPGDNPGTSPTL